VAVAAVESSNPVIEVSEKVNVVVPDGEKIIVE